METHCTCNIIRAVIFMFNSGYVRQTVGTTQLCRAEQKHVVCNLESSEAETTFTTIKLVTIDNSSRDALFFCS